MPKKRNPSFKQLQGSSTSSNHGASPHGAASSPTVNERLGELRRLHGKDAARKKAELAASSNTKSVHPSLKGILGVPDVAPPIPKRGVRARMPNRTPGPAPPASWIKTPGWTPLLGLRTGRRRFRKQGVADEDRCRPEKLMRFGVMTGIHGEEVGKCPPSLLHLALKTAAKQWELFEMEDLPVLATEIPLPLRLRLISYLAFYGPIMEPNVLDALTQGGEHIIHLDLAALAGHGNLSISRLTKLAKQVPAASVAPVSSDEVLESWDQDDSFEAALTAPLSSSRFEQLTHLSLSHPPAGVSWRDLLSFSKLIPNVTHLSLAYWPRPTLTPNLVTATISSQHSPDVTAGGSHFYSVLDEDLYEPASILRQLSSHLLRITWLDLEGCTEWMPALAFHADATESRSDAESSHDGWTGVSSATSIFVRNWKNLLYVNCHQGSIPAASTLQSLPRQPMQPSHRAIIDRFMERVGISQLSLTDDMDYSGTVAQRKAQMWLELEVRAYAAERRINAVRRSSNIKLVEFDHGWGSSA